MSNALLNAVYRYTCTHPKVEHGHLEVVPLLGDAIPFFELDLVGNGRIHVTGNEDGDGLYSIGLWQGDIGVDVIEVIPANDLLEAVLTVLDDDARWNVN